ncbi:hypothetical protein PSL59_18230, partial [Clostridioides difficile]
SLGFFGRRLLILIPNRSIKKATVGIPTINPHVPIIFAPMISVMKVTNTGKSVAPAISRGCRKYDSKKWITATNANTSTTETNPFAEKATILNGIREINTPATGIKPKTKTMMAINKSLGIPIIHKPITISPVLMLQMISCVSITVPKIKTYFRNK